MSRQPKENRPPQNGLACYNQARVQAVLALDFNAKMRLSWRLFRQRAIVFVPLMLGLYTLVLLTQALIYFLDLPNILQLLTIIPVLALFYGLVGLYRSSLWYMDGLETRFSWATFLEPLSRPAEVLPILGVVSIFYLFVYVYPFFFQSWAGYFLLLILCVVLPLFLEYNLLYAAEASRANCLQIISRPFRLLCNKPKIWLSAVAGYALALVIMFIVMFPLDIVIEMLKVVLTPESFYSYEGLITLNYLEMFSNIESTTLLAVNLFYFIAYGLLASAVSVFSIFLFAIAYRQSIFAYSVSRSGGNN